jgi:hypothetical protein
MAFEKFIKDIAIGEYINIVEYNMEKDSYELLMKYNLDNGWEYWLSHNILKSEVSSIFIWNGELACTLKYFS